MNTTDYIKETIKKQFIEAYGFRRVEFLTPIEVYGIKHKHVQYHTWIKGSTRFNENMKIHLLWYNIRFKNDTGEWNALLIDDLKDIFEKENSYDSRNEENC